MADIVLNVPGFEVDRLREEHLPSIVSLMNAEGWYYYDHRELERYLALQQHCFALIKNGRVVGSIFTTMYDNQAWIGNIVVAKEYRGLGLATGLLRGVMDNLHENTGVHTFRLGSVPLAIGLYKKLGFHPESFTTAQETELPVTKEFERPSLGENVRVERLEVHHLDEIAALDARFFRSNRKRLLASLFHDSIKEACFCLKDGQEVAGFLMVRRRLVSKAEGGFAEGPDHAYRLGPCCVLPEYGLDGFKALLGRALPVVNHEVRRLGGCARMYVVFPRNADKIEIHRDTRKLATAMGMDGDLDLEAVFDEHGAIFGATPSRKNEAQWNFMESLGFHQEYFEQVMSCSPGDHPKPHQSGTSARETLAAPEGIFATATPGDKS